MKIHFLLFKTKVCLILVFLLSSSVEAQERKSVLPEDYYNNAYEEIASLLDSKSSKNSFKKAVYSVENAYYEGELSYEVFDRDINTLAKLAIGIKQNGSLKYDEDDKEKISSYSAIFRLLSDTTYIKIGSQTVVNYPFTYDFEDVFGQEDWTQMFVFKLLAFNTGNCHSLPYLYKILAEELGETAHLALAPNHIYIKHHSKKTGWYNTELTSGSFPIDAWLMASGYIHLDAIRNGIYMDTLSQKESLALTLIDLAKGYERKFGVQDGEFMLKAANRALEVNPDFINALLLKAETQKKLFENEMLLRSIKNPNDLIEQSEEYRHLFLEMQNIYVKIHKLGYRQMPEEMYLDWLMSLEKEKERYQNKAIPVE